MITLYSGTEHLTRIEQIDLLSRIIKRSHENGHSEILSDLDYFNEVLDIPNVFIMRTPGIELSNEDGSIVEPVTCRSMFGTKDHIITKIKERIEYAGKVFVYALHCVDTELVDGQIKMVYWARIAFKRLD